MKSNKSSFNPQSSILLMGPPNVGKSVIFNHLTGLQARVANYTGTTVDYAVGSIKLLGTDFQVIDVPGIYTLHASSEAEKVAVNMLEEKPALIICVLDALNLEGSIYLLLQILEQNIPVIAVLNRGDLAEKHKVESSPKVISHELNIPALSTVAVEGKGIQKLLQVMVEMLKDNNAHTPFPKVTAEERWHRAEELVAKARKHPLQTSGENSEDLLVKPWPGLPLAVMIIGVVMALVIGLGMGMRRFLLLPLFTSLLINPLTELVSIILPPGLFLNILVGDYGFLVKGIEWPFTLVLPYVISFYLALSLLEDTGYLPRLGVLIDGLLNKIGLHGASIIPLLLGYGCGIPGIMATRTLGTHKERILVATMISLAVPCVSQTGAFISLLAEQSILTLLAVFAVSILAMILTGTAMNYFIPGPLPTTIMEIPELLPPRPGILAKKVWIRIKSFVSNGALPMIGAVGVASILHETGLMAYIGMLFRPLVSSWLLLPEEAAVPLIIGIFRRELAVLPLLEMELSSLQLFTGAVVALFYVPCIAMIASLAREFRLLTAIIILVLTTGIAFLAGGLLAQLGSIFF